MNQRRSQAVRRRVPARRNLKTVTTRPAWVSPKLPDEAVLVEDGMDAGLGEEVGCDLPWQSADVPETGVEELVMGEASRLAPTAGVDDADTSGTERLILRYLQEAGTVPLLTAADEVRLAEQLRTARAHLLEILLAALAAAAIPPELTPEAWLAEQLRQLQSWVARLDQGQAAAVEADSGLPSAAVRHLWAMLQPWQEKLEAANTDMAIEAERSDQVRSSLQALTPREAYIVRARFGLDTGTGRTLEEIGDALQLSRERVRQLEAHALEKLRCAASPRRVRSVLEH